MTVGKGKTLLVDGPASVTLTAGKAEVFRFQIRQARKIVIREGKRLPFNVQENASFNLALGAEAQAQEVEGDTVPHSWQAAYQTLRETPKKPAAAMVFGRVDSGKTSFCTYLVNRLVAEGLKVALLDEDLGQSDVGPPCTVAYTNVTKPVTDLFKLKPAKVFFVGANTPSLETKKTSQGVTYLTQEILATPTVDYVIVNTDGWATEEAVQFKADLAEAVKPDVVFCLQGEELPTFCAMLGDALAGFRQERVESPVAIRERTREKRRNLRELGYAKYFENGRVKVYALNHITVENKESNTLIWQRRAENLLVALYDGSRQFMGVGVIRDVDYNRKALKVFTAVQEKPASVVFGKIRLDENLREIPEKASA
ncbi:MAG: Clp1/GlmU family protein [Candidatus Bathyarchaeota archaeon]|nr:Clp1/GlmU family protein [Candidatus Bathyarchaeota archaeon]